MKKYLLALGSIALIAGSAHAQSSSSVNSESTPRSVNTFNVQDREFLTMIGQSTLAEVALGKLAAQKSTTPAVRLFGHWMASTDSLANRVLKTVVGKMNGPVLPTTPTDAQQAEFREMQALNGINFDRAYIQMMVPGHKAEIALFEKEIHDGRNPTLILFARSLLPTAMEHLAAVEDLIASTLSE